MVDEPFADGVRLRGRTVEDSIDVAEGRRLSAGARKIAASSCATALIEGKRFCGRLAIILKHAASIRRSTSGRSWLGGLGVFAAICPITAVNDPSNGSLPVSSS